MFTTLFYVFLWSLSSFLSFLYIRNRRYSNDWSKNLMFILGYRGLNVFKKIPMNDIIKMYNEFPNKKCNAYYNIVQPTILVRDVSLISNIVQNQSVYYEDELRQTDFHNARSLQMTRHDSFFLKHLPAHYNQVKASIINVFNFVEKIGRKHFDTKELFARYTCDVLVKSIMGRLHNSFHSDSNSLYILVTKMNDHNEVGSLKNIFSQMFPIASTFFGSTKNKILDSIKLQIESEKGAEKVDHDYINFLADLQKETGTKMDVPEYALSLYMHSHEICTNMLSYMAYELAMNQKVQKNLYAEIETLLLECDRKPSCNDIMMMEYLHMVVSETMRKWPVIPAAATICSKDMVIDECSFWKGEHIVIPITGLHRDPAYFPNPTTFDPERFNDDNIDKITPSTYHPFGLGLKTRLASSLAFVHAKIFFVHFLSRYELFASDETSHVAYITNEKSFRMELQYRNKLIPNDEQTEA